MYSSGRIQVAEFILLKRRFGRVVKARPCYSLDFKFALSCQAVGHARVSSNLTGVELILFFFWVGSLT